MAEIPSKKHFPGRDPLQRPSVTQYSTVGSFVKDMLAYRKNINPSFSVYRFCKNLRKVSPTLISLIIKGKRNVSSDRVDEISRLLDLTVSEKFYLKNWTLSNEQLQKRHPFSPASQDAPSSKAPNSNLKKNVSTHILSHWLNVYVKDCFQLPFIRSNPNYLFSYLQGIATRTQIEKSLQFLLREGHLRRTLQGEIVPEVPLTVTDPGISSLKIRQFHKAALKIATGALDLFSPEVRFANALLLPLTKHKYQEFLQIIEEFSLKIQEFAQSLEPEKNSFNSLSPREGPSQNECEQLYQLALNLSPVGRSPK